MVEETKKRRKATVSPHQRNTIAYVERINLLVLVAGTTGPGNLGDPRAQSYSLRGEAKGDPEYWGGYMENEDGTIEYKYAGEQEWYWQQNEDFRAAIAKLSNDYRSLPVFQVHGWSGDNAAENRRIAGAYLANRLCGSGGERAFYNGWKKFPVDIHLLGHSHGGNVINEFTKRAAEMGADWPKRWKIRSITYLSTPFFKKLHQVDTKVFAPECKLINVHNQYDLTQRVLADFSMLPLFMVKQQGQVQRVKDAFNKIELMDKLDQLGGLAMTALKDPDVWFDSRPAEWLKAIITKNPAYFGTVSVPARPLYDQLLEVLSGLVEFFAEAREMVKRLQEPLWFPVAQELEGKLTDRRTVIKPALGRKIDAELADLHRGMRVAHSRLKSRRESNDETTLIRDVLEDIDVVGDVLSPLATFIAVDPDTLSGPAVDLIAEVLLDQIEYFDNTVRSPEQQLQGTPFADRIVDIDVTRHDDFTREPKQSDRHPNFIRLLEDAERRYERNQQPRDLIDIVLVLAAQDESVRQFFADYPHIAEDDDGSWFTLDLGVWLRRLSGVASAGEDLIEAEDEKFFRSLHRMLIELGNIKRIMAERDVGDLQVPDSKTENDPAIGSLEWLSLVSHSQSRMDLYPAVKDALTGQFTTRLRRVR